MLVSIYLVNGIRLKGKINDYNKKVILLKNETIISLVYIDSIATILSAKDSKQITDTFSGHELFPDPNHGV